MFGRIKKHEQLELKLKTLQMNFENNYKDAAKLNYEEYWLLLDKLTKEGSMKANQVSYYKERGEALRLQMDNFHHQNNVKTY